MGGVGGWVKANLPFSKSFVQTQKRYKVEKHFVLKTGTVLRRVGQILTLHCTRLPGYTIIGAVSPICCVTFNCRKRIFVSIETLNKGSVLLTIGSLSNDDGVGNDNAAKQQV